MAITWISPVEITPTTANAWVDVDVSAYVPVGATGVVIRVKNNSSIDWHTVGFRNNGSTDDLPPGPYGYPSRLDWYCVGIDSNRILELYTNSTTEIDIHLVGYFASNTTAKFFVNCIVKTPATTLAWVDVNIAGDTGTDTAIAAIGYVGASNYSYGVRNNGSTDGRVVSDGYRYYRGGFVVGVDVNEIFEVWVGNTAITAMSVRLQGYIISTATFYVNAIDKSLSSTGVWLDLPALPSGATSGFFEVYHTLYDIQYFYGLRKNGDTTEIYGSLYRRSLSIVECDSNLLIEGKISSTAVEFFLVGYSTAAGETLTSEIISESAVTDLQDYKETLVSDIVSESAATDIQSYIEILLSEIVSESLVADKQKYIESLLSEIVSESIVSLTLFESLLSEIVSESTIIDIQSYIDVLLSEIISESTVTDIQHYKEAVLSEIVSESTLSDLQNYIDVLLAEAVSESIVNIKIFEALVSLGYSESAVIDLLTAAHLILTYTLIAVDEITYNLKAVDEITYPMKAVDEITYNLKAG